MTATRAWAAIAVGDAEGPLWVDSGLSRRNIRDLAASLKTPRFSASNRRCRIRLMQPRGLPPKSQKIRRPRARLLSDSRAPHRQHNAALHPRGHAPLPVDRRFLLERLQGDVLLPRAR